MPGTHLVIDHAPVAGSGEGPRPVMDSLLHLPGYSSETVTGDSGIFLGYTRYPGYPVELHNAGDRILLIEGTIYDRPLSAVVSELTELTGHLLDGSDETSALSGWVRDADGEFVVTSIDTRSGRFVLFNDSLGRLPLDRCETGDSLYISREIGFIGKMAGWPGMDRLALAQTLLFCFPLEGKTLYEGIRRVPCLLYTSDAADDQGLV